MTNQTLLCSGWPTPKAPVWTLSKFGVGSGRIGKTRANPQLGVLSTGPRPLSRLLPHLVPVANT